MSIGETIKSLRESRGMTQAELADAVGVSPSAVSAWELDMKTPRMGAIERLAALFNVRKSDIIEGETRPERDIFSYDNILPVQPWRVPLLGSVAAGEPIYDPEDFDVSIPIGAAVRCDFALRVKGDSMNPTYLNGDIVLIRKQDTIDEGRIAVVSVGEEVMLKHVYRTRNGVTLVSDNPDYKPMAYIEDECDQIRIMGKPVAYLRGV